ncbi:sulfurtransferase [Streptacidiphilus sp. PB12-B1b]|uniref:sulfurtransferase n=1 Tax=Streptacidiphilus sp. PB12-B1b TaxID=2705012 RepID=UPI0015FA5409|nr:sulfurtransferase [Streptacidiphilus sp. PB12-B1b]QMU78691.1 sulfurtransferase [Streptacidiphilus sp. PB12-B1b]
MDTTLITALDLAAALDGEHPPAVLDVRWQLGGPPGEQDYAEGHIPGAHFVDMNRDLAAAPGPRGRHPLPDPEVFGAALRRAGVRADREVVVVDAATSAAAARAWWLLRWAGHRRVRVLDGGVAAWAAAGLPLEQAAPPAEHGDFTPAPGALPTLDADAAAALARTGVLLDARAGERYRGETEPIDARAGHIPGAASAPTTDNLLPDGRFRPVQQLADRFAALGVKPGTEVGVYCGSGVTAAHELLALHLAGVDGALYPGSWSEWSGQPDRPVATGAERG